MKAGERTRRSHRSSRGNDGLGLIRLYLLEENKTWIASAAEIPHSTQAYSR